MTKRLTTKEKNKKLAKEGKMLNHFGIVLRLYPSKEQTVLINKTIGSARLIYNMYFSERQDFYKSTGKTLTVAKYKEKYLVPMKKTEEYNFLILLLFSYHLYTIFLQLYNHTHLSPHGLLAKIF